MPPKIASAPAFPTPANAPTPPTLENISEPSKTLEGFKIIESLLKNRDNSQNVAAIAKKFHELSSPHLIAVVRNHPELFAELKTLKSEVEHYGAEAKREGDNLHATNCALLAELLDFILVEGEAEVLSEEELAVLAAVPMEVGNANPEPLTQSEEVAPSPITSKEIVGIGVASANMTYSTGISESHPVNQDRTIDVPQAGLFGVIDGVGQGEKSHLAAETIKRFLSEKLSAPDVPQEKEALVTYIEDILLEVNDKVEKEMRDMGAVGAAVLTFIKRVGNTNEYVSVNVGDSAIYLINKEGWMRVHEESMTDIPNAPHQLGAGPFDVEKGIQISSFKVDDETKVAIMSDGVTDNLTGKEISDIMEGNAHSAGDMTSKLVEAAGRASNEYRSSGIKRDTEEGSKGKLDDISVVGVVLTPLYKEDFTPLDTPASPLSPPLPTPAPLPEVVAAEAETQEMEVTPKSLKDRLKAWARKMGKEIKGNLRETIGLKREATEKANPLPEAEVNNVSPSEAGAAGVGEETAPVSPERQKTLSKIWGHIEKASDAYKNLSPAKKLLIGGALIGLSMIGGAPVASAVYAGRLVLRGLGSMSAGKAAEDIYRKRKMDKLEESKMDFSLTDEEIETQRSRIENNAKWVKRSVIAAAFLAGSVMDIVHLFEGSVATDIATAPAPAVTDHLSVIDPTDDSRFAAIAERLGADRAEEAARVAQEEAARVAEAAASHFDGILQMNPGEGLMHALTESKDALSTLTGGIELSPNGTKNFIANILVNLSPEELKNVGVLSGNADLVGLSDKIDVNKLAEYAGKIKISLTETGNPMSLLDRAKLIP